MSAISTEQSLLNAKFTTESSVLLQVPLLPNFHRNSCLETAVNSHLQQPPSNGWATIDGSENSHSLLVSHVPFLWSGLKTTEIPGQQVYLLTESFSFQELFETSHMASIKHQVTLHPEPWKVVRCYSAIWVAWFPGNSKRNSGNLMDNVSISWFFFSLKCSKQGTVNTMNMEECYLELHPWGLPKSQLPGFLRFIKPGLLLYFTSKHPPNTVPKARPRKPVFNSFLFITTFPHSEVWEDLWTADGHLTSLSIRVYLYKSALEQAGRESGGFCGHLMTQFSLGCGKWEILRWWHLAIEMKRLRPRCFISIHGFAASSNAHQRSQKSVSSLYYISGPQRTASE